MLLACLDDSGSEDQRTMLVGGVITDFDAWSTLADKWPRLLRKYEMPEFHMAKIGNLTLNWRRKKRQLMMADFVRAVLNLRGQIVAAGVDLQDFKKIREDFDWKKWDPMVLCLEFALQMCHTYAKSQDDVFGVLLDKSRPDAAARVARLMNMYGGLKDYGDRFKHWGVETGKDCYLTQAADLAACVGFRHTRRFLTLGDNKADRELNALCGLSFRQPKIAYLDDEGLRPVAEGHKARLSNRRLFSVEACQAEKS